MIKSTAVVYKVTSAAKQPHECFNLQQYIHRPDGKRRIQYPCSAAFKEVEQYIPHSVWSYELQQRPQNTTRMPPTVAAVTNKLLQ